MKKRPSFIPALWGFCLIFIVLLSACVSPEESATPSGVPSPADTPAPAQSEVPLSPSPGPTEPSPTPIPSPENTDPPAWTGQAADFTGEWQRTEEYIAHPSTIKIADQTEEGFVFSLEAYYYSHVGTADGTAYFTGESTAFWRNSDDTIATGCLFFAIEDGVLQVDEEGQLPFGLNVSARGSYTAGEPVYFTNGVLEALGSERISLLQEVAGEYYEKFLGVPLKYGDFTIKAFPEINSSGLFLEGWMPTMGYQQKIYIGDDGAVWANFQTGQCFTNRPQEEIPEFLLFSENS